MLTLHSIDPILTHKQETTFENIVGRGEIEQFLLFPQFFLPNQIIVSPYVHIFDIISLFAAELEEPKIGISGKVNPNPAEFRVIMISQTNWLLALDGVLLTYINDIAAEIA